MAQIKFSLNSFSKENSHKGKLNSMKSILTSPNNPNFIFGNRFFSGSNDSKEIILESKMNSDLTPNKTHDPNYFQNTPVMNRISTQKKRSTFKNFIANGFARFLAVATFMFLSINGFGQTLIAEYPFNNTLSPTAGSFGDATFAAGAATLGATRICTDNVNQSSNGLLIETINTLSQTSFQVDFIVNFPVLPNINATSNHSVFVIDGGSRYFGLTLNKFGKLKVFFNNSNFSMEAVGVTITPGVDYNIRLQYINGIAKLEVNNQLALDIQLPVLLSAFDWNLFLGDNPGGSRFTEACFSNLKVYNSPVAFVSTAFVTPTSTSLTGFSACSGTASTAQTTSVSGSGLTSDIVVAAPAGFQVSLDGTTYSSSLTLAQSGGSVGSTTIYVRSSTTAIPGAISGDLTFTSGMTMRYVSLSGTIISSPSITGSSTVNVGGAITLSGSLTPDATTPWSSSNTAVATVSSTGVVTGVSAGTATITYTNSSACTSTKVVTVVITRPTITSFSPSSGASGSTVTITGTNFDSNASNNIVYFGSTMAAITSATSTQLVVTVPTGARSGNLSVTNLASNLIGFSSNSFIYSFSNSNPTNTNTSKFDSTISLTGLNSAMWSGAKQNGCFGDIDGDGKTDLIKIMNSTPSVRVLKNASVPGSLSAANFSSVSDYTTLSDPREIEIGDLNNDGKLDLVVTYDTTNISVFINNSTPGSVSFLAKQDFSVLSSRLVRIYDVNNDGKNDLILSSKGGSSVNIYSNTTQLPSNTITLSSVSSLTGANTINHIFIKDINNDNLPDINLSAGSSFYSFINTNSNAGIVSFSQNITVAGPTTVHSNIVEDFNNDNIKDVALGYTWTTDGGVIQNNYLL